MNPLNIFRGRKPAAEKAGKKPRRVARTLRGRAESARMAARGYDSAKTHRVNEKHWADADSTDADTVISPSRATMRNRARYEVRNNGYAAGIINTHAADLVGPNGPTVDIQSDSEKFNTRAEEILAEWFEVCDIAGDMHFADFLRLDDREFFQSGESFNQKVTDSAAAGPVKLRLLAVESDRVDSPFEPAGGDNEVRDGVEVDANAKPIAYYVARHHPGGTGFSLRPNEYRRVPAADMLHLFHRDRPGQTRGISRLAPVLDLFGESRELRAATLRAAWAAALLAVLLYTDHPQADFDDNDSELDIVDLEALTMSMIPQGWKAAQVKPEHPSASFSEFKGELLREAGRPFDMPYLKVAADASGHNYSSARLDNQGYWRVIQTEQAWLGRRKVVPVVRSVITEARLAGAFAGVKIPKRYTAALQWPVAPHVDPQKEAAAAAIRLRTGQTSLIHECLAAGLDYKQVLDAISKVYEYAREKGISLDFAGPASSGPRPGWDDAAAEGDGDPKQ